MRAACEATSWSPPFARRPCRACAALARLCTPGARFASRNCCMAADSTTPPAACRLLWAPSPVACDYSGGVPHEITREEIDDLIQGFVAAASHVMQAGLDGVEVHGAQGYLLQQFMSPLSNRREDEFGGSFENRMRFPMLVLAAVRTAVGPSGIVGYRLGVEEFSDGRADTRRRLPGRGDAERHRTDRLFLAEPGQLHLDRAASAGSPSGARRLHRFARHGETPRRDEFPP